MMNDPDSFQSTPSLSTERPEGPPPDQERIAEQHVNDSSSLAPSRAAQPGILLRSPAMWALYLLTAFVLIGLIFMAFHMHPKTDVDRRPQLPEGHQSK